MPIDPDLLRTGGALLGAVAASAVRQRELGGGIDAGAIIGIYRVVREVGRGGMAVVYLAERADGEYEQEVALKWMLQAQPDADDAALFRRERQSLASLRHPHIARLLDGGRTVDGRPWLAMEFIEGKRLDRHCVEANLPLRERMRLFLQVCSAVAFAHARGIIHRDIKPSNVLVDGDGGAKLLDFGIAQLLGQDDALARQAFTPGFASPEQRRGEPVTVAADIYQLGRLLETLVDAGAGADETGTTVIASRSAQDASRPTPGGRLPADLEAIVRKAKAEAPDRRYAFVDALADDIRAWMAHRPVSARARSPAYLASMFARRHPRAVAASAITLVVLLAMATVFTTRVQAERDLARREHATAKALNRFLNEDVLDAANPLRRAPGAAEVSVREALDAAESRVEARFGQQPEAAASVLTTLGVLRFEFGDYDHALRLHDRALAHAGKLAQDHHVRLRARAERATLMVTMQQFEPAIAELEALVGDATRALGDANASTLEWRLRLLEAKSGQGQDPSLLDDVRALRVRAQAALGHANAIAGEASLLAANTLVFSGNPEQAIDDAQYAHDALAASLGADHPSTLKALVAIAHGRRAVGDGDAAVTLMRQALDLQVARYGADAGDALYMQNELGFTLFATGRAAEAERVFADLVARRGSQPTVPLLQALGNLANTKLRQRRPDDALQDLQRAGNLLAEVPDVPAPVGTNILRMRGDALLGLGRLDEAAMALDASERVAANLAEDDVRRIAIRGSRARLLLARGSVAEGTAMLDEVISTLRGHVAQTHPILQGLVEARAEAMGSRP